MKPNATPTADGTAYDLNASAVLLVLADTVCNSHHTSTHRGRMRATRMIEKLLQAARAGGYTQADILETLLNQGDTSARVTAMCSEAMAAAGNERIGKVFAAMRQNLHG